MPAVSARHDQAWLAGETPDEELLVGRVGDHARDDLRGPGLETGKGTRDGRGQLVDVGVQVDVAVHLLRVDGGAGRRQPGMQADLDAEVVGGAVPPQVLTVGAFPDERGELVQGEVVGERVAGPEPVQRCPAGSQRQTGDQRPEPRPGRDDHLLGLPLGGRGAHGNPARAGLDAGDHRVRVDLGAQPPGRFGLRAHVALGVADPGTRVPDRDVVRGQARVLRLARGQFLVAELHDRQAGAAAAAIAPRTGRLPGGPVVRQPLWRTSSCPVCCPSPVHSSRDFRATAARPGCSWQAIRNSRVAPCEEPR